MRLVLIYLGRKGAGPVYSLEFARALLNQGVNLLCCVSENSSNINEWKLLETEYSETKRLSIFKVRTFDSLLGFLFRSLNIFMYYHVWKRISDFGADALLATMIHPWHEMFFLFFKGKLKRIKIIHDVAPHLGEESFFSRTLTNIDIKFSDYWITLTENSKKKLVEKGIASTKICVIPHAHFGFYNKFDNNTMPEYLIRSRIGFFGRINKYKGISLLLSAYNKVCGLIPNLKLLIAGSGTLDGFDLRNENIEIHNRWIEDNEIIHLLNSVDFLVLPYIEASQSGVIPLAFSMGKPVIVTDVGGLSEQVPNECGIVVPPNNIDALSNAILYFYENKNEIAKKGRCAYDYAYNELSWDISAKHFLSAFAHQ